MSFVNDTGYFFRMVQMEFQIISKPGVSLIYDIHAKFQMVKIFK